MYVEYLILFGIIMFVAVVFWLAARFGWYYAGPALIRLVEWFRGK